MKNAPTPLAAGIYLVGVPIGNARDITLRALDTFSVADHLAAEDTRTLRKLLDIHGVPLGPRRIEALHDHSSQHVITRLITAASDGKSVAYASEAGMPLVSDPGYTLVQAAHDAGVPVTSVPGATAVTTALAIGGLPADSFHFIGFLPSSSGARRNALAQVKDIPGTLVVYESPHRIVRTLADARDILGAHRPAVLCRELTKKFEERLPGTLESLAATLDAHPRKGEMVLLIGRPDKSETVSPDTLDEMIREALENMSLKDAASYIASQTGLKKRAVYQRGLEIIETKA